MDDEEGAAAKPAAADLLDLDDAPASAPAAKKVPPQAETVRTIPSAGTCAMRSLSCCPRPHVLCRCVPRRGAILG